MFGGELRGLEEHVLLDIFSEVPSSEVARTALDEGKLLVDVLTDAGVFPSKGEARRLPSVLGARIQGAAAPPAL